MADTGDLIDKIVDDLIDESKKLSSIMLKVQLLATEIENEKLKSWIKAEIHGYDAENTPEYRKLRVGVSGNLIQDAGFRGIWERKNVTIPLERLDKKYHGVFEHINLNSNLGELEELVTNDDNPQINLSPTVCSLFSTVTQPWNVIAAWQEIGQNQIEGILLAIRSSLLDFISELRQQYGRKGNYESIVKNSSDVDKLFQKTIVKSISGENVNVTLGDGSNIVDTGKVTAPLNIATGDNASQQMTANDIGIFREVAELLRPEIEALGSDNIEKNQLLEEIGRLENELSTSSPNTTVLGTITKKIEELLTGVASSQMTPFVLEKLKMITSGF